MSVLCHDYLTRNLNLPVCYFQARLTLYITSHKSHNPRVLVRFKASAARTGVHMQADVQSTNLVGLLPIEWLCQPLLLGLSVVNAYPFDRVLASLG